MKKTTLYLLLLGLSVWAKAETRPKVVATASIFADMAAVVGGNLIEVETIVPIGGDPHTYEPTPRAAQLVAGADLILKNGLTFEGWLNELIENSGTKAESKLITNGVDPIESKTYQNAADPHAWMDARYGLIYIANIKDALIALDPDNREAYEFNYGLYKQQLEDLDQYIRTEILKIPEQQRILITSHDAFQYYGKRYGLQLESVLGTSTDAEAQTSDILKLNKIIQENKVPSVFIETTVNPKLLKQIAADNDIRIGGQLYSDSIGDEESSAPTYLDMLKYNTDTIVEALSRITTPTEVVSEETSGSQYYLYGILGVLLIGGFALIFTRLNR